MEHGVAVPASMSFARLVDGVKALPVRISLSLARATRRRAMRRAMREDDDERARASRAGCLRGTGTTDDATRW